MMGHDTPEGHPTLTDQETGLPNRLHFVTVFDVTFGMGHRGIPLTLVLLEIDHYLTWHQAIGPEMARESLRTLGFALGQEVRQSDVVARTDEGRFALALLDCDLAGAESAAQRVFEALTPVLVRAGFSVSLGVASYNQGMTRPEDLIGAAEEALRSAQARGGDQIQLHR